MSAKRPAGFDIVAFCLKCDRDNGGTDMHVVSTEAGCIRVACICGAEVDITFSVRGAE